MRNPDLQPTVQSEPNRKSAVSREPKQRCSLGSFCLTLDSTPATARWPRAWPSWLLINWVVCWLAQRRTSRGTMITDVVGFVWDEALGGQTEQPRGWLGSLRSGMRGRDQGLGPNKSGDTRS